MDQLTQHTINTPYMVGPVHCYTGNLAGELVLFDTGPPTPEGEKYLRENVDLENLKHVIVTHCHIDHYGLTHWLERCSDAQIYLPELDCLKISQHDRRMAEMYTMLSSLGFDGEYLESLQEIFLSGVLFPPFPENYLVAETEIPDHLGVDVISCPGHSQSDLVYDGGDWVVTGDTLLRGIFQSPLLDVDLVTGDRFRNYEAYCKTVVKLGTMQGKTVYPAHRQYIGSIRETLIFYISKMLVRTEQIQPYKDEENVMQLMEKLLDGRKLDVFTMYLKASEIVFMKDFLEKPELLKSALQQIELFEEIEELYSLAVQ